MLVHNVKLNVYFHVSAYALMYVFVYGSYIKLRGLSSLYIGF